MTRRTSFLIVCLVLVGCRTAVASTPRGSITIDRIAQIKHPGSPAWSPDNTCVAFLWDAAGKQDLFVVSPGQPPVALTNFPIDPVTMQSDIERFAWLSPEQLLFAKNGQLWTVTPSSAAPERVANGEDVRQFSVSADRKQIAFVRAGQIWVATPDAKGQRQLTFLQTPMAATGPVWSRDAKWIAFEALVSRPEQEAMPSNGNVVRQYRTVVRERRLGVVSVYGSDPVWVSTVGSVSAVQWTADGSLLYEEVSPDRKSRFIKVSPIGGVPRTLWTDDDPAYWSVSTRDAKVVVSPDGRSVAFSSDRTGRIHLYVMPTDASSESLARQITSGNYLAGVGPGGWSPDSRRIAYHRSGDGNQMERSIAIADTGTGRSVPVETAPGVNIDAVFSPDGEQLMFQRTSVEHSLDLYVTRAHAGATSARLTHSMPDGLLTSDLTPPVAVNFPSRADGKLVPATLMVSKKIDRTKKHPAIVWVHASSAEQNFLGWHPHDVRMYYSMHQYLAQQGFVILTPDARGSSGYGRDWTTGNHMDVGVGETLDVASGADYLKTLGYVDPDKIAIWGLSYGGFQTLQTATRFPTLFRCAIDIAGVTHWETHRPPVQRMGTPSEDVQGYERASPLGHMDRLGRPLLILHGTADTNVYFSQTLQLLDALLKQGKHHELALYPGEGHYFRRAHVLRDAWRRVEEFFERHLQPHPPTTSP